MELKQLQEVMKLVLKMDRMQNSISLLEAVVVYFHENLIFM